MAAMDPDSYLQRRESFTRSLHHFHETRGTAFKRVPNFGGKEIDLFKLYNLVTERGGWVKVNRSNSWDDLLVEFDLPKDCTNGGNALKQIYLRYLDRYEKVHFLGENGDRNDEDEDVESRHRRWSSRSMHTVALTYNHHQHNISDTVRRMSGLSTDLYKSSEYDRLALSLVSPLPNEQDFAINLCTVLSNEGKHTLRLDKCPRLLEYLLAHAGIYNHSNLRILFEEMYGRVRGHSLSSFWSEVLEVTELRDLTDENKFQLPHEKLLLREQSPCRQPPTPDPPPDLLPESAPISCVPSPAIAESAPVSTVPSPAAAESAPPSTVPSPSPAESAPVSTAPSPAPVESAPLSSAPSPLPVDTVSTLPSPLPAESAPASSVPSPVATDVLASDTLASVNPSETAPVESHNKDAVEEKTPTDTTFSAPVASEASNVDKTDDGCEAKETPMEVDSDVQVNEEPKKEDEENKMDGVKEEGENKIEGAKEEDIVDNSAQKMEVEVIPVVPEEPKPPPETEEEKAERLRREKEEAERLRKEEEERLKRELIEAEHYEAMLRAEERKQGKGRPLFTDNVSPCFPSEVSVLRVRKHRTDHLGLERLQFDDTDRDLFNVGRDLGTRDLIGQRILQVANILRNLSFNEEVVQLMARNTTFLRFLLLCANSRWSNLHQLGLDMLGNVAPEIRLEEPSLERIVQILFGTVSRGIRHSDRFVVLSSLEVLNKVCQRDDNEDVVSRNVDQKVYEQVCRLLSLHDIMVLLYTLECLYSMSSMGEKACNAICRSRGAIQMLLSLITVEAQSYGPKACILMRVIETVSGGSAPPLPPTFAATPVTPAPQKLISPQPQLMRAPSPKTVVGMPMGAVATPVPVPNPNPMAASTVTMTMSVQTSQPTPVPTMVTTTPSTPQTVQQQHAHQQTVQENEQFAQAWVRANYELSAGGKVEQHEIYRKYVEGCAKLERKGVITAMHFPRIVRSVFGGTVGPKPQPPTAAGTPTAPVYDGIQVREVPLTINVKLVPVHEAPPTPNTSRRRAPVSPILKAQLVSSPTTPTPTGKVTQRQAQAKLLQALQLAPQAGVPTILVATPAQQQQQQTTTTSGKTPVKIVRVNGVIQQQEASTDVNHVPPPTGKGKKEPPQPPPSAAAAAAPATTKSQPSRPEPDDSDSRASCSRDFTNLIGESQSPGDNDNSLTSFEGIFLNGIDLEATFASADGAKLINNVGTKPTATAGESAAGSDTPAKPKSQMLADLLDKKETPLVNGVIGEKGLELVEKAILADKPGLVNNTTNNSNNNNNGVGESDSERTSGGVAVVVSSASGTGENKRPAEGSVATPEPEAKRPKTGTVVHMKTENGSNTQGDEGKEIVIKMEEAETETDPEIKVEVNGEEEVRASSKAANLFAALAAEALEDEEIDIVPQESEPKTTIQPEVRPMIISDPLLVTAGGSTTRQIIMAPPQSGQVLISAGGQLTLQKSTGPGGQSVPVVLQNQRIVQSGGQQYIVSGNSASPVLLTPSSGIGGQGQTVLLTQATNQQGGNAPKTIIILQPQTSVAGGVSQPQKLVLTSQGGNVVVGRPAADGTTTLVQQQREVPEVSITQNGGQLHVVQRTSAGSGVTASGGSANSNGCQQIQVISSGVQNNAPILTDNKQNTNPLDHSVYLCEWRSCMRSFKAASDVYLHVCSCHCPVDPEQETQCLWGRCDGMKRKRFSLMTHLYDRHCNAEVLNMMAVRRRQLNTSGRSEIPAPPPTPPHPGYAPNAAFHAIKRHAGDFVNPKELMQQRTGGVAKPATPIVAPSSATLLAKATAPPVPAKDDNEGPVTKSIRLTASLILRNLIIYSSIGRRFLKGYEPHLASIALSNVESSRTIAQVLADMNDTSGASR